MESSSLVGNSTDFLNPVSCRSSFCSAHGFQYKNGDLRATVDFLLVIPASLCSFLTATMVRFIDAFASAALLAGVYGASPSVAPSTSASTSWSQFTMPASADVGVHMIANIDDANAVRPQSVCPGYKASDVHNTSRGFEASLQLAGEPCNAYGTDVESLTLSVEYQAADRLNIQITPTHVDASNASWYLLPEDLVPRPKTSCDSSADESDLAVSWSNDPSFNFKVTRKATGDVLFNTEGSVLVYENQFIEFVSALPEDYNLYGLGEHIQQLRLLNNLNLTIYAADIGDPINR